MGMTSICEAPEKDNPGPKKKDIVKFPQRSFPMRISYRLRVWGQQKGFGSILGIKMALGLAVRYRQKVPSMIGGET